MRKRSIKLIYAVILILFSILVIKELLQEDNFVLEGWITQQTFIDLMDFYEKEGNSSRKLIVESEGGDGFSAIAIGKYIREKGLDIEVMDYCVSACANYIFTAGKTKYLNERSQIIYHGGAIQESLEDQAKNVEQGKIIKDEKEAYLSRNDDRVYDARLLRYLGLKEEDVETAESFLLAYRLLEKTFFEEIGVDQKITIYGQIGEYEKLYLSKKYIGFYYGLDDLRKMGVTDIVLKESKWKISHHGFKKDFLYLVEINDQ